MWGTGTEVLKRGGQAAGVKRRGIAGMYAIK